MGHSFVRLPRGIDGVLQLGELHFAESQKNVIFAWKMVEEGPFADIGDICDVFDGVSTKPFSANSLSAAWNRRSRISALRR
jgi:hypothetical protein